MNTNANVKQITDKTRSIAIFRDFGALLVIFALSWQSAAAQVTPDDFEVDNTPQAANFLPLDEPHGPHNFHVAGDQDWVRLIAAQGEAGLEYFVEFSNEDMDLEWTLYDSDGESVIASGENFETFNWPEQEGFFFIQVTSASDSFGDASYNITITPSPSASVVYGNVHDEDTNEPLAGVTITIKGTSLSTKTDGPPSAGGYGLGLKFESSVSGFILIAEHDGYEPFETPLIPFDPNNFIAVKKNIALQPEPAPDPPKDEIIGTWSSGIWYWDMAALKWTRMTASTPTGDLAAGNFIDDGIADVASSWDSGLWYQDGDTLTWIKIDSSPPFRVTAGDVTGDGRDEIIGSWSNGIRYWDVVASQWTQMTTSATTGDIAAGDFTGDGKEDVASIWTSGLWYQDGDTLTWIKIDSSPPFRVTAGDVTGDGRDEIIGSWDTGNPGIWYWDFVASQWTQMTTSATTGDIAAGDFTGDGKEDVASIWTSGLWYQDGDTLVWTKVSGSAPINLTAGDVTGQ